MNGNLYIVVHSKKGNKPKGSSAKEWIHIVSFLTVE